MLFDLRHGGIPHIVGGGDLLGMGPTMWEKPIFSATMFCLLFGFVKSQFFGLLTGVGQKFFCRELKEKIERKRIEKNQIFKLGAAVINSSIEGPSVVRLS